MIREEFPAPGSRYLDGYSDGWEYNLTFRGTNLQHNLEMIRAFLDEEGYAEVPVPATSQELLCFRIPTRNQQILMFADNGYVHNPIKILFDRMEGKPRSLILKIYNEKVENHLLRFHGKVLK